MFLTKRHSRRVTWLGKMVEPWQGFRPQWWWCTHCCLPSDDSLHYIKETYATLHCCLVLQVLGKTVNCQEVRMSGHGLITTINKAFTYTHTLDTQMFNGLFSRTTWVVRYQKDKPFWILLKQEMMGWQWHQLNHNANHLHLAPDRQPRQHLITPYFLQGGCPSCRPTNSVKSLKAKTRHSLTSNSAPMLTYAIRPITAKQDIMHMTRSI